MDKLEEITIEIWAIPAKPTFDAWLVAEYPAENQEQAVERARIVSLVDNIKAVHVVSNARATENLLVNGEHRDPRDP